MGSVIRYRLLAAALVLSGCIFLLWTANPERSVRAQGLRETAHVLETLSHGTPEAWADLYYHPDSGAPPSQGAARKRQATIREHLGAFVALQDASCTVIEYRTKRPARPGTLHMYFKGVAQFEKATADVELYFTERALCDVTINSAALPPSEQRWRRLVKETQIAEGARVLGELLSAPTNDDDESLTRVFRAGRILRNARMHAGNASAMLGLPIDTGCIFAERVDEKPGQLRLRYALVGANRSGLAHVTISTGSFPRTVVAVRFELDGSR